MHQFARSGHIVRKVTIDGLHKHSRVQQNGSHPELTDDTMFTVCGLCCIEDEEWQTGHAVTYLRHRVAQPSSSNSSNLSTPEHCYKVTENLLKASTNDHFHVISKTLRSMYMVSKRIYS